MKSPTKEQNAVIGASAPRFSVRAGAGSGKTSVLVERYVRNVVEMGLSPESIVTVTFTRKAAAEMKARIVARLRDADRLEEAQMAETGPIQTIHSFCERILRENAVEALVDPTFEVLGGAEARTILDRAVQRALHTNSEESPWAAEFVRRLAGRSHYQANTTAHSEVRYLVENLLEKLRSSGVPQSFLRKAYESPEATLAHWMSALVSWFPEDAEGRLKGCANGSDFTLRLKDLGIRSPGWLKGQTNESDLDAAKDTTGLLWLALEAWDDVEAQMERLQKFDFALLESKAVRLIETSEEARSRIQRQCRAVLVDEAQDLNPLQYRIINSLTAPGEMMVGDPQQSIYGFRHADRGLFIDRCGETETFPLTVNHRSEPGILNFVDAVFGTEWGQDHTPMRAAGSQLENGAQRCDGVELWPMTAMDSRETARLIHHMVKEGVAERDVAVLTQKNESANTLCGLLTELGVPARTIGASEKFYTRLEVRDLANALDALSDPTEDFSLLALLRSPFVGLSADGLVWHAAHRPVLSSLSAPGPLGPEDREAIDRFLSWFDRGRERADRIPAWETLAFLLRETPYLEETARIPNARQTIANVRKLLAMAAVQPEMDAREFAHRLRAIQFIRHREGEAPVLDERADAVTLTTIHKAKGLEFDVVVLPEMHKRLTPNAPSVASEPAKGLVASGLRRPTSAFYRWLAESQVKRERDERLRVLYVGMTRAKRRLCLVVDENGGADTLAGVVAKHAGLPNNPLPGLFVRRSADPP